MGNNKVLIILLSIISVILLVICVLFANGTIVLNSDSTLKNTTIDAINDTPIENIQVNEELVKITSLTFEKPRLGTFGGGEDNTLFVDVNIDLNCTSNNVAGVRLYGYCLDTVGNKYMFEGPLEVAAFYCKNNLSHVNTGSMIMNEVFDSEGKLVDLNSIKLDQVKVNYCKIDKAKLLDNNTQLLDLEKVLNFEKNFD